MVVIAATRALGDLRRYYHEKLSGVLLGEIAKDLTGSLVKEIEHAISAS